METLFYQARDLRAWLTTAEVIHALSVRYRGTKACPAPFRPHKNTAGLEDRAGFSVAKRDAAERARLLFSRSRRFAEIERALKNILAAKANYEAALQVEPDHAPSLNGLRSLGGSTPVPPPPSAPSPNVPPANADADALRA